MWKARNIRRWFAKRRRRAELTAQLEAENASLWRALQIAETAYNAYPDMFWRKRYALKMRAAELEAAIAEQVEAKLAEEFPKDA